MRKTASPSLQVPAPKVLPVAKKISCPTILKPPGDQAFTTGIEPWGQWGKAPAPGVWHFYSYWHEMKGGNDGKYWGNFFDPPQPEPIQPGRWYCIEAMLKANSTPEAADGEQAFWVDGKKIGEFKGIRWRTADPSR